MKIPLIQPFIRPAHLAEKIRDNFFRCFFYQNEPFLDVCVCVCTFSKPVDEWERGKKWVKCVFHKGEPDFSSHCCGKSYGLGAFF